MFCTKCGKELREGAAFCSGCGAPVNGETKTETKTEQTQKEIQKDKQFSLKRKWAILLCVAVILVVVGIVCICTARPASSSMANQAKQTESSMEQSTEQDTGEPAQEAAQKSTQEESSIENQASGLEEGSGNRIPDILINGKQYNLSDPYQALQEMIDDGISATSAMVAIPCYYNRDGSLSDVNVVQEKRVPHIYFDPLKAAKGAENPSMEGWRFCFIDSQTDVEFSNGKRLSRPNFFEDIIYVEQRINYRNSAIATDGTILDLDNYEQAAQEIIKDRNFDLIRSYIKEMNADGCSCGSWVTDEDREYFNENPEKFHGEIVFDLAAYDCYQKMLRHEIEEIEVLKFIARDHNEFEFYVIKLRETKDQAD